MKNLYDCHVHLNLPQFSLQRDLLLEECGKLLDFCINVGFDEKSSEESLSLAYGYPFIKAAVGIHPTYASSSTPRLLERISAMLLEEETVALGEIGLDYYWMKDLPEVQKAVFEEQMEIAAKRKKPVLIHDREAHDDTLAVLKTFKGRVRGVLHSFSGDETMAKKAADLGYYLSISGPVTYTNKKNARFRSLVSSLPPEWLLIETDSPYLAPVPFRGKTNSPLYVAYVAREIASLKQMEPEEFLRISRRSAKDIFGI